MRREVMRAGGLGFALAGCVIALGCDDNHTGQPTDPPGPVLLMRVMVQDSPASVTRMLGEGDSTRGAAVDLLEDGAPVACSDVDPCQVLMAFGGGLGDYTCRNGVCNDPLKPPATGVPLNPDIEDQLTLGDDTFQGTGTIIVDPKPDLPVESAPLFADGKCTTHTYDN